MIEVRLALLQALGDALDELAPGHALTVAFESPKQAGHGDLACTAAMQLARPLKKPPREASKSSGSDNGEAARRRALAKRKAVVAIGIPRIASAVNAAFKADSVKEATEWWRWMALAIVEAFRPS